MRNTIIFTRFIQDNKEAEILCGSRLVPQYAWRPPFYGISVEHNGSEYYVRSFLSLYVRDMCLVSTFFSIFSVACAIRILSRRLLVTFCEDATFCHCPRTPYPTEKRYFVDSILVSRLCILESPRCVMPATRRETAKISTETHLHDHAAAQHELGYAVTRSIKNNLTVLLHGHRTY